MKRNEWKEHFPEVPDTIHQMMIETLDGLEEREEHHMKKTNKMKKRTIVLLAAALIGAMGMTAGAAGLFKWNEKASEVFEADEILQDHLVMESVAQEGYQTVTDNGITIRLIQTVQDSNCFYALFDVTAEDGTLIDENNSLDMHLDYHGTDNPFAALSWGFVDARNQEVSNSRYFEIYGTKMSPDTSDLNMNVNFVSFNKQGEKAGPDTPLITGNWDFTLSVHPSKLTTIEVNDTFTIAGCPVYVQTVELSPLSVTLTCKGEDVQTLETSQGVDLMQLDTLRPMMINGVKYRDGSIIDNTPGISLSESFDPNGEYVNITRFSKVIEPEKAAALLMGDDMEEIRIQ